VAASTDSRQARYQLATNRQRTAARTGQKHRIDRLALLDVVGLARQRTLVHLEIIALNYDSVSRQQITCQSTHETRHPRTHHVDDECVFWTQVYIWVGFERTQKRIQKPIGTFFNAYQNLTGCVW